MTSTTRLEPRHAEPGGFPAIGRWSSEAIPPESSEGLYRIPEGCQRAVTPAGVVGYRSYRGCRFAQPPANRSHPSGMIWPELDANGWHPSGMRTAIPEVLTDMDAELNLQPTIYRGLVEIDRCIAERRILNLKNKKPMDIGFTGLEARNTRHEAEFRPPAER